LQLVSQHGRIGIGSGFMGQLEPFKRCSLYTRFSAHICCQATTYALGVMAGSLLANVHILTKLFEILLQCIHDMHTMLVRLEINWQSL